jgi:hypothetical protein
MRKILAVIALGALGALAACGGDNPSGPSESLSGTYSLTKVNNLTVPAVVYQDSVYKYELIGGTLAISGSAYTVAINERETINGAVTAVVSSESGTVSMNGSTVTFTSSTPQPGDSPVVGTFSGGNTITVGDQYSSLVFQK